MSEEQAGKRKLWLPVLALALLGLLGACCLGGLLAAKVMKRRSDRLSVTKLAACLKDYAAQGTQELDPQTFNHCLAVLEDCQDGVLDPAKSQMELPSIGMLMHNLGFGSIEVTPEDRDGLKKRAIAVLTKMTGQGFGEDTAKWRNWQGSKAAAQAKQSR